MNNTTLALFVIILICLPCGSTGIGYELKMDKRNVEKIVMNEEIDRFEPFVVGNNNGYLIQAYFPKHVLEEMLPNRLSIPDDAIMESYFPGTPLYDDVLPFMASFCHGSEIHDIWTNINVPEQEEMMFLFPVIYTHTNGDRYLCSYSPVLYLDSFLGVIGGLFFGLRKEYHPGIEHGDISSDFMWWSLVDIFDVTFERSIVELDDLPSFMKQIFSSPYVSYSYPLPFEKLVFFQTKVYPNVIKEANEELSWNYKGIIVEHSQNTLAVYSSYYFTMSKPMNGKKFFELMT